jgi:glycosyltransferase involved in cell wall biosynthesis
VTGTQPRTRVLVIIKCLDPGGAERLVATMIHRRDTERFDYEVAYLLDGYDGLVDELRGSGVRVHSLGGKGNYDLSWLPRLRRLLREGHFDVVHSHLSYAAIGTRLAVRSLPRRSRPAIVYTEHSVRDHLAMPVRALAWATLPLDDRILTVGETNRALLPRYARRRAEVVIHGVDRAGCQRSESQRLEQRSTLGVKAGDLLLVTVANLRPQKAYPTLLRASRLLIDEGWPVVVVAAGGGPLREELDQLHAELELGDRFRFLGFHPDTISLAAAADVFVLASDYEAMPVAVMEAMAVGAPIVATAVGDVPLAIDNGTSGVLVPPGSPELLADALRRLLADPEQRIRLGAAAEAASEQFDIARATRRVESIYLDLASQTASATSAS